MIVWWGTNLLINLLLFIYYYLFIIIYLLLFIYYYLFIISNCSPPECAGEGGALGLQRLRPGQREWGQARVGAVRVPAAQIQPHQHLQTRHRHRLEVLQ